MSFKQLRVSIFTAFNKQETEKETSENVELLMDLTHELVGRQWMY